MDLVDDSLHHQLEGYLQQASRVYVSNTPATSDQDLKFIDDGQTLLAASDFLSVFIDMNRSVLINSLSFKDKRFVLFGADQIVP